jgi:uncharacterized protein YgbK (DUF1537 family)
VNYVPKLMIIADDYTGALDAGVQFSKKGITTLVLLYKDLDLRALQREIEVIVVDTESRHIAADEATERVQNAARLGLDAGVSYFYKKTDSALRGNIGSELFALMQAGQSTEMMFVPAYPDANRTTVNGCQMVEGVPLDKTAFANDPIDPVDTCDIGEIIHRQADVRVVSVKETASQAFGQKENTVYVFDAETNDDMDAVAAYIKGKGKFALTAGCAGFGNNLPEILDLNCKQRKEKYWRRGKTLIVCGSVNAYTLQQVSYAKQNNFTVINLSARQKLDPDFFNTEEGRASLKSIIETVGQNDETIITTQHPEDDCEAYACTQNIPAYEIPYRISKNIAQLVREITLRIQPGTMVLIGGDTSLEVVNALGITSVIPYDEISTGVVLSEAEGKDVSFNLITKSGGFGEQDVLLNIRDYLSKHTV